MDKVVSWYELPGEAQEEMKVEERDRIYLLCMLLDNCFRNMSLVLFIWLTWNDFILKMSSIVSEYQLNFLTIGCLHFQMLLLGTI